MYTFLSKDGLIITPHLNHVLKSFCYATNMSTYCIDPTGKIMTSVLYEKHIDYTSVISGYFKNNIIELKEGISSNDFLVIELYENICIIVYPVYLNNQVIFYLVSEPFSLVQTCELTNQDTLSINKLKKIDKQRLPYIGQLFNHLSSKAIYAGRHHFFPSKKMKDTKWAVDLGMEGIENTNSIVNVASVEKIGELIISNQLTQAKDTLTTMQSILSYSNFNSCPMLITKYKIIGLIVTLQYYFTKKLPNSQVDLLNLSNKLIENIEKHRSIAQLTQYRFKILEEFSVIVANSKRLKLPPNIQMAIDYIHKHYNKNIKLIDIANSIPMNETYLSTQFKSVVGQSFKNYLNNYRITQSLILLKDHNCSLTEVANLVGFESTNYFSTVFKKLKGISPSQYIYDISLFC